MMGFGNNKKLNKKAFLFAMLHWILSFFTDRLIFTYQLANFTDTIHIAKSLLAWGAKLVFAILLIVLWQVAWGFVLQLKEQNDRAKSYFKYTVVYFAIMLVFFILLFPGLWRLDEFGILKNATAILPHFWQGYLTSVFFIFALMLIPNPAGILLVQIFVISLIVGYVIEKSSHRIKNKKLIAFMYLPFLLFPVIDSNFYPIRMSIYAFLELLLVVKLIDIKISRREIDSKIILCLSALVGILICWRTESIYYIILAPITFIVLFYKETTKKLKIQFVVATLFFATALTSVQMLGNRVDSGKEYEITSMILPITPLVDKAYKEEEKQLLFMIDKVFDTKRLSEGYQEGKTGISMYWSEPVVKENYTQSEFQQMKSAYYQLILRYPDVFSQERIHTFLGSTGILNDTQNLFSQKANDNYVTFRETYQYKEPLFRAKLVQLLEFTNQEKLHHIVYSFIIQTIVLLVTCMVLLIQRKWGYFFLCASICAKIPVIFLTAPSQLFMYYYSIYLIGAVWIGYLVVRKIDKRFRKEDPWLLKNKR